MHETLIWSNIKLFSLIFSLWSKHGQGDPSSIRIKFSWCHQLKGVISWKVSSAERCHQLKGVISCNRCQQLKGVFSWKVSTAERCQQLKDVIRSRHFGSYNTGKLRGLRHKGRNSAGQHKKHVHSTVRVLVYWKYRWLQVTTI